MKRILTLTVIIAALVIFAFTLSSCTLVDTVMEMLGMGDSADGAGDNEVPDNGDDTGTGNGGDSGSEDEGGSGSEGGEDSGNEPALPEKFDVVFMGGGADLSFTGVKLGDKLKEPEAPVRAGYNFVGWFNGNTKWDFETDTVSANLNLTARWELVTYTVTYELFGGTNFLTNPPTYNVENGSLVLGAPERAGYIFSGWYTDAELLNKVEAIDVMLAKDITLYASWTADNFNIKYELFGGTNSKDNPVTYNAESGKLTLGAPEREGYAFLGWFTDEGFENEVTEIDVTVFSDITLYALWKSYDEFYTYDVVDNGAVITGCTAPLRRLKVPAMLGGYNVTAIADAAFEGNEDIEEVIFPDTVEVIGVSSFAACANLKSVSFGAGLKVIGDDAFKSCLLIVIIVIPDSVETIGISAFEYCSGITSLTIGNGVTTIGTNAFSCCESITVANIGSSVEVIGEGAFKYCGSLTEIVIPDSVKSIGKFAFADCTGALSITIGNGVTEIGDAAFESCTKAESLSLGASVKTIGGYAFNCCVSIKVIFVPDSVSSIGEYAFADCTGALSITIGNGVTTIGESAFIGCMAAESLTIGVSVVTIGDKAFYDCVKIIIIIIPDSVKTIGVSAFEGCRSAESIKIGNGVTTVGDFAFSGCSGATKLTIGSAVTTIGAKAFYECTKIDAIVIPDSVKTLGESAFEKCSGALSIKIGNGVTAIPTAAFSGCSSATELKIGSAVTSIGDNAFYLCIKIIIIIIPDNVRTIGSSAFFGCSGATTITVGNGTTSIGSSAFEGCSSAEKVELGSSVTTLGDRVFYLCIKIVIIIIPESVTNVGNDVFGECNHPTVCTPWEEKPSGWSDSWTGNVSGGSAPAVDVLVKDKWVIVYDVEIIVALFGDWYTVTAPTCNSFGIERRDSTNVEGLSQSRRIAKLEHTYVDKVCTACGAKVTEGLVFKYNSNGRNYTVTGLGEITDTDIVIPAVHEGYPVVGIASNAFAGRTDITGVYIPSSVKTVSSTAFKGCTGITELVIPDSVTNIGNGIVADCTSLEKLVIPFTGTEENTKHAGTSIANTFGVIFASSVAGDGLVAVEQTNNTTKKTYYIPASLKSVTVNRGIIAANVFANCSMLTEIIIGEGVTQIGNGVFSGCTSLESMYIPKTVQSFNAKFNGCTALETVEFEGLTSVSMGSFGNSSIKTVKIGDGASLGGNHLGSANTNVENIIIGKYVEISTGAFDSYTALKRVEIGYGTKAIGYEAFDGCTSLTTLVLPDSVKKIGQYAFRGCTALESITMPADLEFIDKYAFQNCTALTSIVIPDKVETIGMNTFYNCQSLTEVTIGTGLKTVETYAFYNCNSINKVNIKDVASYANVNYYSYTSPPMQNGAALYVNGELCCELIIPEGVLSINSYAFYGFTSVEKLVVPNSVTTIGQKAFAKMTGLKTVVIGSGVESCGADILQGCSALEELTVPFVGSTNDPNGARYPLGYFFGTSSFDNASSVSQNYSEAGWNYFNSKTYYIPNSLATVTVTSYNIHQYAFHRVKVPTVILGEGVTKVDGYAFYLCSALKNVSWTDNLKSIGTRAFQGTALTEVYLGDNIEKVGSYIFANCNSLKKITMIGAGETAISDYAFSNCSALTEIVIGDGVISIGSNAFYADNALTTVRLGKGIKTLSSGAFASVKATALYIEDIAAWCAVKLESISANPMDSNTCMLYVGGELVENLVIPEGVTEIGDYAFYRCKSIKSVVFPSTLTKIGLCAFEECANLESIDFGGAKVEISKAAFYLCSNLASVDFSDSVSKICENAFNNCTSLKSITVPGSVKVIEKAAFKSCTSLETAVIENGVEEIGEGIFYNCKNLVNVTVPFVGARADTAEPGKTALFGYIFDMEGQSALSGFKSITQYYGPTDDERYNFHNIPLTLRNITVTGGTVHYGAFYGFSILTEINLGKDVLGVGDYVFYNCTALNRVSILSSNVEKIGEYAFFNCKNLVSVEMANSVKEIGNYAFNQCTALTDVTTSDKLTRVGKFAFYYCQNLTFENGFGELEYIGNCAFYGCKNLTEIYVSSDVEFIGSSAFEFCSLKYNEYAGLNYIGSESNPYLVLMSVTDKNSRAYEIHENTMVIYSNAFMNCYYLESINIPASVTTIFDGAFRGCYRLTSITLPKSLTRIENNMFYGCYGLTEIVIPSSVTHIGTYAFYNCSALNSIDLPDGIVEIGGYAFYGCKALKSVTLPEGLSDIGMYAFYGCEALESINLPESLTVINDYVFYGCKSLETLHIGKNVTEINITALEGCSALESITVDPENEYFTVVDGNLCTKDKTTLLKYISKNKAESYVIPESITTIGAYAFAGDAYLKTITISKNITSIGKNAFSSCTALERAVINASIDTLPEYCFSSCANLKSFTLAENITVIGFGAFQNSGLVDIIVPDHVTALEGRVFEGCKSAETISLGLSLTRLENSVFAGCIRVKLIVISSVEITTVRTTNIDTFSKVGSSAEKCTLIVKNTVKSLPSCIFADDNANGYDTVYITDIVFEAGRRDSMVIGGRCFAYCKVLKSVMLPAGVTISTNAFNGCTSLDTIYFVGNADEWSAVSITSGNTVLATATVYYYSMAEPEVDGNFWHYDENGYPDIW